MELLTEYQINDIIKELNFNYIPNIPNNIINNLKDDLKLVKLKQDKFNDFKSIIINEFYNSKIPAKDCVGATAATSLGEPSTQMTLNTFHLSGVDNTNISSVDRLINLLQAAKQPNQSITSMTIYFNDKITKNNIFNHIKYIQKITINTLINNVEIHTNNKIETLYTFFPNKNEYWYDMYKFLYDIEINDIIDFKIRLKFNLEYLYFYKINLLEICSKISFNELICIPSPLQLGIIDVFIKKNKIYTSDINTIDILKKYLIPKLLDIHISGIDNITDINISYINDKFVMFTTGSNIKEILLLDFIDDINTISNCISEIFNVYGIDLCREYIINECKSIYTANGISYDPRHMKILADYMTHKSHVIPITRHGHKEKQLGILSDASFEEISTNLIKSGFYGKTDKMKNVSSEICVGNYSKIGTGNVELYTDHNLIKQNIVYPNNNNFKHSIIPDIVVHNFDIQKN